MYDADFSSVEITYFHLVYFTQQPKLLYKTNLFLLFTRSTTFVPAAGFSSNYFILSLRWLINTLNSWCLVNRSLQGLTRNSYTMLITQLQHTNFQTI